MFAKELSKIYGVLLVKGWVVMRYCFVLICVAGTGECGDHWESLGLLGCLHTLKLYTLIGCSRHPAVRQPKL